MSCERSEKTVSYRFVFLLITNRYHQCEKRKENKKQVERVRQGLQKRDKERGEQLIT